jgi:8-oxo-dGTP pyrophosphatase MutT (NUDIX family)
MEKKKRKLGAGFVLFRKFGDSYKILVLIKKNGQIDLPKGGYDKDYDNLDLLNTAKRETYEESGITVLDSDIISKEAKLFDSNLTFFVALTNQEPKIKRNPKSGEFEHRSAEWVEPTYAFLNAPNYLSSTIKWGLITLKKFIEKVNQVHPD